MNFDVDDIYEIEEGYEIKLEKKDEEIERLNRTNNEIFKANETLAEEIKKLQNQLQQKDIKIKELSQWDTNKDTRNSRQRIANNKLEQQLKQKEKEIKDLKQKNDYLNDLEASAVEYKELKDQLQQKENIIKEVREYINWRLEEDQDMYKYQMEELLEILDKGE